MTLRDRLIEQLYMIDKIRFPSTEQSFESTVYQILSHQYMLAELMLEVVSQRNINMILDNPHDENHENIGWKCGHCSFESREMPGAVDIVLAHIKNIHPFQYKHEKWTMQAIREKKK